MKKAPLYRRLLPQLITSLTGNARYLPSFEWSNDNLVYNIFRVFELIFWREEGIRKESAASIDTDGFVVRQFFTLEALLSYGEGVLRKKLEFRPVRIWIPVFSTPSGLPVPMSPYLFAIATDTSAASTDGVSTGKTLSYTASGSNNLIIAHCAALGTTSAATWNGSGFTRINTNRVSPAGDDLDTFCFVGATGTQNIVTTCTSSYNAFVATSYSGVNQSTTPDSSNGSSNAASTSQTISTTVVAANCWTFLSIFSDNSEPSAGTGSFKRQVGANIFICAFDSNGTVSTGSVSMATSYAASTGVAQIICSFAPAGTVYTPTYSESVTPTDDLLPATQRTLSESKTATDTFASAFIILETLSEAVSAVDSIVRSGIRVLAEALTATDTFIRESVRTLAESQTATDTITNVLAFGRTLTESVGATDIIRKVLNGSSTIWDNMTKNIGSWINREKI